MTLLEIIVMNFFTASSAPLLVVLIFNIRISDLKLEKKDTEVAMSLS